MPLLRISRTALSPKRPLTRPNHLPRKRGRVRGGVRRSNRADIRGGVSIKNNARVLRRNMTDAEQVLRKELSKYRLGWRVGRQFPIPPYIVDFGCVAGRL